MAYVEVEIDLEEFSDRDLIEELQYRDILDHDFDIIKPNAKARLHELYLAYERGQDYQNELRALFYEGLGKIC